MTLKISISSVSLKGTQPKASDIHGASYVFDLRCLPNPGREAKYKPKTGLDKEVVEYLSNDASVNSYLEHVKGLVNLTIKNYQERAFDYCSFTFGCTGGQHRSVYFAKTIKKYIEDNFSDIEISISHISLKEKGFI